MTEVEWLTGADPARMLTWLEGRMLTSQRKLRLFVLGACRHAWPLLRPPPRRLVEAAEDEADCLPVQRRDARRRSRGLFHDALLAMRGLVPTELEGEVQALAGWAFHGVDRAASCAATARSLCPPSTPARQAGLVRELFGNPFRKARRVGALLCDRVAAWPEEDRPADVLFAREWLRWGDGVVARLAESIHAERRFERLPYLADALEEAGCAERELLGHLRRPGEHARGCWVLDLILGRE